MADYLTYIGTYTDGDSEGIYRARMDEQAGTISGIEPAATSENPSYLATHPTENVLYTVNENEDGAVTAFQIGEGGHLDELDHLPIGPAHPCYCSVDATGQVLLAAHYTGGAVSATPLDADGSFGDTTLTEHEGSGADPERQESAHPHSIVPGPHNEYVYVPDLGADQVVVYDLDPAEATLVRSGSVPLQAGAGPRHLDFTPGGERAVLINELDATVTLFAREADGNLRELDSADTLAEAFEDDNLTADIHVHPTGAYVYGSNRGHDSIAVFDLDDDTISLRETVPTGGEWPRNFVLSPDGSTLFVANAHTNDISPFDIDDEGGLSPTDEAVSVPQPVCIEPVREL
jgi:6-phosphogluconolactonase